MSGLKLQILPDSQPTPTDTATAPLTCCYCKAGFPPRRVGEAWAEFCLDCKRKRHHKMQGFPKRYADVCLSQCEVNDGNREAMQAATEWCAGDRNLWFYGSPGSGKTFIASAAAHDGPIGLSRFVSVPEMLLEFQSSVKEHDELQLIRKYCVNLPSVTQVFDDVGAHRVSDFSIEMFTILLERFYASDTVGLIFTSNLSPQDILTTMGERVASRLRGLARPIKLTGKDWRVS